MKLSPLENFLSRTTNSRYVEGEYRCSCPGPLHARGDKNPSLSVKECEDGAIILYCFAGCSAYDIVSAVGLTMRDLYPQQKKANYLLDYKYMYESISNEAIVLACAAQDISSGKTLSKEDLNRLQKCALRLAGFSQ